MSGAGSLLLPCPFPRFCGALLSVHLSLPETAPPALLYALDGSHLEGGTSGHTWTTSVVPLQRRLLPYRNL